MGELVLPLEVNDHDDAQEFIRFWIAGRREFMTLHVGAMGDNETKQWGMMLADLSIHIVRALQQDGSTHSEDEIRAELERAYLGRLADKDANHTGTIGRTVS